MINPKKFFIRFIFLFLLLFPLIENIQSQDIKKKRRIDIENADFYTYDEKIIANAVRLLGNVRFRHNEVVMFCDSAYQYNNVNMVDAFGNVHIVQGDTLNLYGDRINYNGNNKLAKVRGKVKLIDKSITLTTDSLNFDLTTNIGNYTTGGKIVDTSNVLTSINGKYFARKNLFLFKDSVILTNKDFVLRADTLKYNSATESAFIVGPTTITGTKKGEVLYSEEGWYDTRKNVSELYKASKITNKDQSLEGDTLFYDRKSGNGRGRHHVVLTDTTNHVRIKGNFGIYNENTKIAFVTDSAIFMQFGKKDTLYMHADTLKTIPDPDTLRVKTSSPDSLKTSSPDSLKTTSPDSLKTNSSDSLKTSSPDSLKTNSSDSLKTSSPDSLKKDNKIFMAYPRVRFFKSDLSGKCDSLSYQMKDSTIFMYYDPVLWSQKNQMTADHIQYISKKPEPSFARLEKNAFIIMSEDSMRFNQISGKFIVGQIFNGKLRVADVNGNAQTLYYLKNKDKYTGVNNLMSSKIYLHLKGNKMDTIRFYPKPEGKTIPMKEMTPEDSKLAGFVWREKERPKNSEDLYPLEDEQKKTEGKSEAGTKKETKGNTELKGEKSSKGETLEKGDQPDSVKVSVKGTTTKAPVKLPTKTPSKK